MTSKRHFNRREFLTATLAAGLMAPEIGRADPAPARELEIDHVMFPVFFNDPLLAVVEENWSQRDLGKVWRGPPNPAYKGVYLRSRSFYVEYLSTARNEPYWSSALSVVLSKEHWRDFESPALVSEYFLIPQFGCGYFFVSPDYPQRHSKVAQNETYDGLTIFISKALEAELLQLGGLQWSLPSSGKIRAHPALMHRHDIAVVDHNAKLVAPLFEANPLLRDHL